MSRPQKTEYAPYYERYISLVENDDVLKTLEAQPARLDDLCSSMSEEKGEFRYAEGKWSIKELLGHIIDTERMFAYRLLRISRGDETPIEGFEQDYYIENAQSDRRSIANLLEEFSLLRRANVIFCNNMTPEAWKRMGTASQVPVSATALIYMLAGHVEHHVAILKERYLT